MSKCFVVGDKNTDLREMSAIGIKYSNSLKLKGCCQGIEESTRVTPTSESLLDHIVHKDCLRNLQFVDIKPNITERYATYVLVDITKSQSFRFQPTRATSERVS